MRIQKRLYLLSLVLLIYSNCVFFLPNGTPQQGFSPFAFLLGLVGGSPGSSQNLTPGTAVDLSGDGKPDGTLVDSDGDGVSDGINLTGGTTPNLILIDTNGDGIPDAVDSNGDGLPDYYISPNPPGFLTTGPGGSGNPVVIIVDGSGNPIGFDTDGDGTPNDTAIVAILNDTTAPTLTSSLLAGIFSTTQTTTLTCTDNRAPGFIVYSLDGSTPAFSPKNGIVITTSSKAVSLSSEGTHTLNAACRDLAGNLSTPLSMVYTIDTQVPAISIVSQSSLAISSQAGAIGSSTATWRTNRSGSFTVREGSACDSGTIAATGTATANVDQTFVRSHTHFTGEGTKTYRICVTGSNALVGFASVSLLRDDTAPVVSADPGAGSYGTATSVSLSCSDTGGSGCDQIAYALQAGSAPTNPAIQGTTGTVSSGTLFTAAIGLTDGSVTYTKFVARDKAGNVSSVHSANYTVDTQVATVTVNSHTAAINGSSNVTLSWQSSKAGNYQIRLGGSSCSTGTALTNTGSNANVTGNIAATTDTSTTIANSQFVEGENTIRICVANLIDSFGSTTRITNKDTTAPVVTMSSPTGSGPFASGTQLQLSCSDTGGSGCDKVIYTLNGTEPTFDGSGAVTNGTVYASPVALSNGSNQVKFLGRDVAGNTSTAGNQSFDIVGPPDAPVFVTALGGGTTGFVQWWQVTGATSYTVYYSTSPGVTTSEASFGPVTDPYATITGLNSGTLYYFRVAANNVVGQSALSLLEAGALTTGNPPGTNLTGDFIDLSADHEVVPDYYPSAAIDEVGKKLYVSSTLPSTTEIRLVRCELNGTNCIYTILTSEQSASHWLVTKSKLVFDPFNKKIIVINNIGLVPSAFICDVDLSNCNYKDISAGQGQNSATNKSIKAIVDPINKKLLVLSENTSQTTMSLFRCDLDGLNCTHTKIMGSGSSYLLSMIFDQKNQKLLIAIKNSSDTLTIFRCNIDGTTCSNRNYGTNRSGSSPSIAIDTINDKLLIATTHFGNSRKPNITQCNLDGTGCTLADVSTGQSYGSGNFPILNIDLLNRKILLVTRNDSNYFRPSLYRCDLNRTNCTHTDLIGPQGTNEYGNYITLSDYNEPEAILDPTNGKLLIIVLGSRSGVRKLSLFIW
ncbi:chitobiase/beta-hexosaminidase C-terminal domain-containing protein [Leptospira vanthielii]|uniref:Chitobiase/beta-hexosaminidase C-terminal domain protein n=1 Tax=Leptospira vanthielii serovar Holland str. Waz Holland = ATCC 700522 TaxID=1218591 RepID=N1WD70_9LEPT|nr:chitobiase/beta-hexosaminidase C-terminal domain-containing protein [Leptospira vanthielii]EMY69821.1 chitobiase/beta-hexosaminidase C-terminal domain protein [Leptospira vanthielii serovar Holland str. Waz Holland = ATCC 700522]